MEDGNRPDVLEYAEQLSAEQYTRAWNALLKENQKEQRKIFWRGVWKSIIVYFCVLCAAVPFFLLWAILLRWVILRIPAA